MQEIKQQEKEGICRKRLKKHDILTVPNFLTFFRILLVPVIMLLYLKYEQYVWAAVTIIVSGATDIADGIIARKFNCISDFGKFADPVADKMTQCAIVLCLALGGNHGWMLILFGIQIAKEVTMFVVGLVLFRKRDVINSARWYGKVTTATIYVCTTALVMFRNIPDVVTVIMACVCGFCIIASLVLYMVFFARQIRRKDAEK